MCVCVCVGGGATIVLATDSTLLYSQFYLNPNFHLKGEEKAANST